MDDEFERALLETLDSTQPPEDETPRAKPKRRISMGTKEDPSAPTSGEKTRKGMGEETEKLAIRAPASKRRKGGKA
jgi:hypothetical protein